MGKFGLTEILVIAFVVLLLFGGRKIPELMRGLGQGVKEFKNASNGETGGSKGTSGNETKSE
jgi:sec-independent protein translocase protein TatA